jgi:Uma2 family endonuclease
MSADEYLEWDATQSERTEFVQGEVFAMAGAEDRHVTVAANLHGVLRVALRGTRCRAFISDMKLRVDAADCFFYPDVFVTCSEADRDRPLVKRDAILVAEVLSPGTGAFDRGDKFAAYRMLPTLAELLLIDPASRRTDAYRKGADGLWVLHPFAAGEDVHIAALDVVVPAAELFENVDPPAAAKA